VIPGDKAREAVKIAESDKICHVAIVTDFRRQEKAKSATKRRVFCASSVKNHPLKNAMPLSYDAIGSPSYLPPGATGQLYLAPTKVQGHIQFTVEVTVQDGNGLNRISKSQMFTLDTQVLTWSG